MIIILLWERRVIEILGEKSKNSSLNSKKVQVRTEKDNQIFECSSWILTLQKNLKYKLFLLGMDQGRTRVGEFLNPYELWSLYRLTSRGPLLYYLPTSRGAAVKIAKGTLIHYIEKLMIKKSFFLFKRHNINF